MNFGPTLRGRKAQPGRAVCDSPPDVPHGFTLTEALVALAVLGILLGLAAPAMSALRQKHQMQAQAEDLLGSLMLARSEALKRQERVTLCLRGPDGQCAASGSWAQGWLVFVDRDADARRGAQEEVLQLHDPLPEGLALTGNGTMVRYISYGPEGYSLQLTGQFQSGTLSLCRAGAPQGWRLVVNALGKPRLEPASWTTDFSCEPRPPGS